jgi:hypothetical protein
MAVKISEEHGIMTQKTIFNTKYFNFFPSSPPPHFPTGDGKWT